MQGPKDGETAKRLRGWWASGTSSFLSPWPCSCPASQEDEPYSHGSAVVSGVTLKLAVAKIALIKDNLFYLNMLKPLETR